MQDQDISEATNEVPETSTENTTIPETEVKSGIQVVESAPKDEETKEGRYKDGEELTFVRVRFPGNSRSFQFLLGKRGFTYGQRVVAMSDRGMDVGYINSFPYDLKFNKSLLPMKSISKIATDEDIINQQKNIDAQKEAEVYCVELIKELKLQMNITHVEIIQFGKKMVFYFTAPARVDFRELVKQLVAKLKMRIELRQISVRDRAAAIGSIGPCGGMTCCSSFLKNYGQVTIKMAKNQNLALIPSKLNGVCGQIKCCIKYEDDVYAEKRKLLPREGNFILVENKDKGKVTKLHILVEQFDMLTDKGQIRRYSLNQYNKNLSLPKEWSFPERFDHIVNETKTVIGLVEKEQKKSEEFIEDYTSLFRDEKNEVDKAIETTEPEEKEKKAEDKPKNQNRNKNRNRNRNRNRNNNNKKKDQGNGPQKTDQGKGKA